MLKLGDLVDGKGRVSSFRFQVSGRGEGFRFQVSGFKFQVSGFKFQVGGMKFQEQCNAKLPNKNAPNYLTEMRQIT